MTYRAVDLVGRKRDGNALDRDELEWLVSGYLDTTVSEGQMAAFLMAGVLRGFSEAEARALTGILVASGETLDLSGLRGPTVDKHSTGGVSDGTTLLVAPLLAAAGAQLVKLSGRGLGHTGGTLDKLESVPGLRTALEPAEMLRIADDVGCVVAAQTARLVPADKALYALRDVTATVGSPALIASSVMSKKLASGAQTIVLDVKAGDGAFLTSREDAVTLAKLCVAIGTEAGRQCTAVVSAMDQPLGSAVGNAVEVVEAVELLAVPPRGRLAELALELAALGLVAARGGGAGRHAGPDQAGGDQALASARDELRAHWNRGAALETLRRMIMAQGGAGAVCDRPREILPTAPVVRELTAERAGTVAAIPARAVGELAALLGAGRARAGDTVDPAVGVELAVEVGDTVEPGQVLARILARDAAAADEVGRRLRSLLRWRDGASAPPTLLATIRD